MTRNSGLAALTFSLCLLFACSEGQNGSPGGASTQVAVASPGEHAPQALPSAIGFAAPRAEDLGAALAAEVLADWEGFERGEADTDALLHSLERELAVKGEAASSDLILLLALAHVEDASGLTILGRDETGSKGFEQANGESGPPSPEEIHERLERPAVLLEMVAEREPASSSEGALARINLASVMRLRAMLASSARMTGPEHDDGPSAVDHLRAVVDEGPESLAEMARVQLGE